MTGTSYNLVHRTKIGRKCHIRRIISYPDIPCHCYMPLIDNQSTKADMLICLSISAGWSLTSLMILRLPLRKCVCVYVCVCIYVCVCVYMCLCMCFILVHSEKIPARPMLFYITNYSHQF